MNCHKCNSLNIKRYLNINPMQQMSTEQMRKIDIINFEPIHNDDPSMIYLYKCNDCGFVAKEYNALITFKHSIKSFEIIAGLKYILDKYEIENNKKKDIMEEFAAMFDGKRKRISTPNPNIVGKNKILQMYEEIRPKYTKNVDAYREMHAITGLGEEYIKNTVTKNKKKAPKRPK